VIDRHVYRCRRDLKGGVTALVSTTAAWSPRSTSDVIVDIESGRFRYVIDWGDGPRPLMVMRTTGGPRLEAIGPDSGAGGLAALPSG
jgi:hypothetical protein